MCVYIQLWYLQRTSMIKARDFPEHDFRRLALIIDLLYVNKFQTEQICVICSYFHSFVDVLVFNGKSLNNAYHQFELI